MTANAWTVAITDYGWYEFLLAQNGLEEVNFWTPSAHWAFRGDVGSPFFFKLKARYDHAICGFAHSARNPPSNEIGCILLAQPTFFQPDEWVAGPE